ncbi:MAG TPA: hypothetical protein DHV14_10805 [Micrococcales bacterium]|uniref:hypothetical protein n=1 Tax=Miniimonas TaxID=947525 RepID=UPI000D5273E9|nr:MULTISPECIES: hypothetical protein [Miniimonas]HCX85601.1 hypothetical protein [Micrococcales bacterium]
MAEVRTLGASTRAVVSAAAAALVAIASYAGTTAVLAVVAVLLLAFAWGWPRLVGLPVAGRRAVLLAVVAVLSLSAVLLTGDLEYLAVVAAAGVIGAFVLELTRDDGRPRLVDSLSASCAGVVVVVSGAGWVGMGRTPLEVAVVFTAAGTLAAGAACAAIHLPPWVHAGVTIVGATVVGAVAGLVLPELGYVGAIIGFASGLLSAALHQLLGRYPAANRLVPALAAAVLPVVVVGVPVYVIARFYLV